MRIVSAKLSLRTAVEMRETMKKVLIIGGAGFVGRYLAEYLSGECGYKVSITKMKQEVLEDANANILDMDLLVKEEVEQVLAKCAPDYIFHLAAQSSVALSWSNPQLTVDVNKIYRKSTFDRFRRGIWVCQSR